MLSDLLHPYWKRSLLRSIAVFGVRPVVLQKYFRSRPFGTLACLPAPPCANGFHRHLVCVYTRQMDPVSNGTPSRCRLPTAATR